MMNILNDIKVLPIVSDPTNYDGDRDGKYDNVDKRPLAYDISSAFIYQSEMRAGLNSIYDEESKLAPDMTYNDYEKKDLDDIEGKVPDMVEKIDDGKEDDVIKAWKDYFKFWIHDDDMEEVSLDMIDHFINGSGEKYTNDILTAAVLNHQSTKNYIDGSTSKGNEHIGAITAITDELKRVKGDLSLLEFKQASSIESSSEFINTLEKDVGKPRFTKVPDDIYNGLTFCINDTWGNNISIKDYEFDGKKFKGTICFTIYDNFGLDPADIEKTSSKLMINYVFKNHEGFPAWFVLQHYKELNGKYKPFVDYIYFEKTFEGTVD